METVLFMFGGIANLVAVLGGSVAAIFVSWAGIKWMTSSGEPQKISEARSSLIGVLIGLLLVGASFMIPDAINQRLIRPATGQNLSGVVGLDCDRVLQKQLVRTRTASDADRMNSMIRQVQASKEGCGLDNWSPLVSPVRAVTPNNPFLYGLGSARCEGPEIGQTDVPRGLQQPGGGADVRNATVRDADNNIMIYFDTEKKPSDGAGCWIYHSRLKIWDRSY